MECRFGYVNLILQRIRLAKDILIENELTIENSNVEINHLSTCLQLIALFFGNTHYVIVLKHILFISGIAIQ